MTYSRPSAFFVGEHLAIDFINTLAKPEDELVEWLRDGKDLIEWLKQAGVIEAGAVSKIQKMPTAELDDVAEQARNFRQWLRGFVTARMGNPLRATSAALAPLNELLASDHSVPRVELVGHEIDGRSTFQLHRTRHWESPHELLQPIAHMAADLICHHDFRLIRTCEGADCVLLFLDTTKAHSRRWCSMAVCGNRAKVAAFRARRHQD